MSHASGAVGDWQHSMFLADGDTVAPAASVVNNPYSKVDKTGFIGFFANYIEIAIDFGHNVLPGKNTYGLSIILFTLLSKSPL